MYVQPQLPLTSDASSLEAMFLDEEIFRHKNTRQNTKIHYLTASDNLFPHCQKYKNALESLSKEKGVQIHYRNNIKKVDVKRRSAIFEDLFSRKDVEMEFDLMHLVPPMSAHKFIRENEELASESGFVDVDKHTMNHKKYPNIFALGDAADLPTAKTAQAVFSQAPVVSHNLI